ncbi:hypothetical protein M9M90_13200 [Phenylobacterium sp. LH3H17]|uniref:hypothetical protein n=1 Tax=Phenylobacterium sp. LH3H17 TaxID=2903901 RepID=UPI0020CA1259|nr:hypothetical protein [Phenylobacterium sp. LH3H17]UTP38174.1 hypothetical protein M9M90_13200 [Phenylobacterium sp. LH3H17]
MTLIIPENIISLGRREAELRSASLAAISGDKMMSDHLDAVEAAMSAIMDHVRDRPERGEHELIVKRLGIRLFNGLASGLSQGFAGYYQQAWDAVRDVVELQFLFDDFSGDAEKVMRWATMPKAKREKEFRPGEVRKRLNERYSHEGEKRRAAYQMLSTMASHPSPDGFLLTMPKNDLSETGPFYEERFLRALLGDMAQHGLAAAVNFTSLLPAATPWEQHAKRVFMQRGGKWLETYMGAAVAKVFADEAEGTSGA